MTTPVTAASHQAPHRPTDTGLGIASIAELITHRRRGLHRVNDHFLRVEAIRRHDEYIALDMTQIQCTGEDPTIRGLLYPTATIEPGPGAP